MAEVKAHIDKELYLTEMTSPSGNILIADEPVTKGGQNKGFSPTELLAAALASCTCITLRAYADRKNWDLQKVDVAIILKEEDNTTNITRQIQIEGNLDETQRSRLLTVANTCPVHKILSHPIGINTQMNWNRPETLQ